MVDVLPVAMNGIPSANAAFRYAIFVRRVERGQLVCSEKGVFINGKVKPAHGFTEYESRSKVAECRGADFNHVTV